MSAVVDARDIPALKTLDELAEQHWAQLHGLESRFIAGMATLALLLEIEETKLDLMCESGDCGKARDAQEGKVEVVRSTIANLDAFREWSLTFGSNLHALTHPEDAGGVR